MQAIPELSLIARNRIALGARTPTISTVCARTSCSQGQSRLSRTPRNEPSMIRITRVYAWRHRAPLERFIFTRSQSNGK